ncbi:hypothetical protein ACFLQ2_00870 [archaeon]
MLLEIYFTFLRLPLLYGDYQATLIIAFLSSLVAFAAAVAAKLALKNLKPWYFSAFLATEAYFLLAQTVIAFWYGTAIPILTFFEPATYTFVVFVMPMAMVYRKIMEKWPVLPWHLMIYFLSLLASLVFWYFMVFVFQVFALL